MKSQQNRSELVTTDLHEEVSLVCFELVADGVTDPHLNRQSQLVGLNLLVRHLERSIELTLNRDKKETLPFYGK